MGNNYKNQLEKVDKNAGGRPLKFQSVEELQKKIDQYFEITTPKEITITGLAIHLDTTRNLLSNYEDFKEFNTTIKKAKARVKLEYEKDLRKQGRSGDIFALKNFGWSDKHEIEHSGNITLDKLLEEAEE